MYPDLSYIFHAIFGTPVDNATSIVKTFGFILVLAFMTSAYFLFLELKRKAAQGLFPARRIKLIEEPLKPLDLLSNALFGFILFYKLGYLVSSFNEFRGNEISALISFNGNWGAGVVGAILFAALKYIEKRNITERSESIVEQYPYDKVGDFTIVAAVSGLLGAKIFAIIESTENIANFLSDPFGQFFSGSGLAMYGGLIGGTIGISWYSRKLGVPLAHMADSVATALMVGYAVGRLGCHFSGDGDWGIVAAQQPSWWFLPDWLWAYDYPHNVNNQGVMLADCKGAYCHHLDPKVYPTPLYEMMMCLGLGAILWSIRKKLPVPGMLFFVYLIFNGIERFTIEKIRVNDKIYAAGLTFTQAELIAVVCVLVGSLGFAWLWSRREQK